MKKLNPEYYYQIRNKLRISLGEPEVLHQSSPLAYTDSALEVLLATILTQATSDKNALRAWLEYKKVFQNPVQILRFGEQKLLNAIHSAGLATQKTRTIIAVVQEVKDKLGECSLDSLQDDSQRAWDFLNELPGVGPKTAACTMLFGLGLPQFPVDVHIQRIVRRLGWITKTVNPEQTQEILVSRLPEELYHDLHILLLNLGRRYCRPHQPFCEDCPLLGDCLKRI
jgi:endonuclease III